MIAADRRINWPAVTTITVVGLVLRLFAARGALWLDEAWSATFAQEAGTPLGILLHINHDNNHPLNTLWLQIVGSDASPMLQRALSILCGTATIPLAALFGARRGPVAALIAALGFAIAPVLVTYGAEARGYAPMLAATLAMLVWVDRWLARGGRAHGMGLAVVALLGTLAQPLMLASLIAIAGWVLIETWRRSRPIAAMAATARVIGPALIAAVAVIAVMLLAASASPTGFVVGSYTPFAFVDWIGAIDIGLRWTLGFHLWPVWLLPAATGLAAVWVLIERRRDGRSAFYAIALLAYPIAFALFRIGNPGSPRYYLLACLALLLLLADLVGAAIARGGWRRSLSFLALAAFLSGSAWYDASIIRNRRADPARAIAVLQSRAPGGAAIALPDERMTPVLTLAARNAAYPLRITSGRCDTLRFLFLDSDHAPGLPAAATIDHCGALYRTIASAHVHGLSGTYWWLFERVP